MDGFRTQFDHLVHHLYTLHGLDCTYERGTTSWTVRLIPHVGDQYLKVNRFANVAPMMVYFRSLVSVAAAVTALVGKTAASTFVTPQLRDEITVNGETYRITPGEDDLKKGWRYLNDRRTQIEICTMKTTKSENH